MTITYELDLNRFEAWSGAVSTLKRIRNERRISQLEAILEELYPNGMTETELNDLLWFESELVYEWCGMKTEAQIQTELEEAKDRLAELKEEVEDLQADYNDECIGIADWERKELWEDDYKDTYDDLQEQITDVKETISELEEEYAEI